MKLPSWMVGLRSALAQGIGRLLRLVEPVSLRVRRFVFEVWARSALRGPLAAGVQFTGWIAAEGTGRVRIGAGTRVGRRVFFETHGDARIEIGRDVVINDDVVLAAHAGIRIGDHVLIGEGTSIRDANHGTACGRLVREQPHVAEAVCIGRDAWIGRGVAVLKGVQVADGAVVGANAVVTSDVGPGIIVAGIPARPIARRGP